MIPTLAPRSFLDCLGLTITIKPEELHPIDQDVFGQFMARPAFGNESGPEAAMVPGTHQLQARTEELIRKMQIPVMRFPGGTDVNYMDWTDMIDHAAGKSNPERPLSKDHGHRGFEVINAYGLVEFSPPSPLG